MTTANVFAMWWSAGRKDASAEARTDPPQRNVRAPVFIHDAVTPYRGETMLLARLRADLEERAGEEPD